MYTFAYIHPPKKITFWQKTCNEKKNLNILLNTIKFKGNENYKKK